MSNENAKKIRVMSGKVINLTTLFQLFAVCEQWY